MEAKFTRCEFDATLTAKALSDPEFRRRLISNPSETYQVELGRSIPTEAKIVIVEEQPDTFYVVLPYLPDHLRTDTHKVDAVARRKLTFRDPCWGIGDGPE